MATRQWYNRAITLDRNWRKRRREEKKLRGQRDNGVPAPRVSNAGIQGQ